MSTQKLTVIDPVAGFTERDPNSKAILNTDISSLIKNKIQKRRFSEINKNEKELIHVKEEIDEIFELNNITKEKTEKVKKVVTTLLKIFYENYLGDEYISGVDIFTLLSRRYFSTE